MTLNGVTLPNGTVETITISSKSSTVSPKYEDGTDYIGSANSNVIQTPVVISATHNNVNYEQATSIIKNVAVNAVAHNGNGTYYSTIGRSMSIVTAGTVYVIPSLGIDVPINGSVTIPSGVTLALPYENTTTYGEVNGSNDTYPHANTNTANRITNVVVNNSTLTNNGSIIIGGIINGGGGTFTSGHSTGKYTQITLNSSTIENNGSITAYGYIDESGSGSKINNNSTGSISAPFVVVENRGGTTYSYIYFGGMQASPFNTFYIPNIYPTIKTVYGGSIYGLADLYASDQHNKTTISLIGSDNTYLIKMDTKTVIETRYNGKMKLDIYGNISLNSLSIAFKAMGSNINISTSNLLFPISYYFDIDLYRHTDNSSSSVSLGSQSIKFMPGSCFHIHEGVSVDAPTIIIYDSSFVDTGLNSAIYPANSSAQFIVDGYLNVDNIGGHVTTTGSTGQLDVNSSGIVSSKELNTQSTLSVNYNTWKYTLALNLYNGSTVNSSPTKCGAGSYFAKVGGWYAKNLTIYYNANGGTLSGASSEGEYPVGDGYLIEEIGAADPTREHYEFDDWYIDEECRTKAVGQTIFVSSYVYAKWIPKSYTITYSLNGGTNHELNPSTYNIESTINLRNPQKGNEVFGGWYTDSAFTNQVTSISNSYGNITLYALWYPAGTSFYTVNYNITIGHDSLNDIGLTTTLESAVVASANTGWAPANLANNINNIYSVHYYFDGWYTNANYTTRYTSLSGNTTLYGRWLLKSCIVLTQEGKSNENYYYVPGSNINLPSRTNPSGETTIWFTNSTLNSSKYYIGGKDYSSTGVASTLYGDYYYVVDKYDGNFGTDKKFSQTSHENILIYNLNLSNSTYVLQPSCSISYYVVSTDISKSGAFYGVTINKLIIDNCTITNGSTDNASNLRGRKRYIYCGMFEGCDISQIIIANSSTIGKYTFSNSSVTTSTIITDGTISFTNPYIVKDDSDYSTSNSQK